MSVVSRPRPLVKVLSSSPCFSKLSRKVVVSRCSSKSPAAEAAEVWLSVGAAATWNVVNNVHPSRRTHVCHVKGVGFRTMGGDHKRARGETSTRKRGECGLAP